MTERSQRVIVEGEASSSCKVHSGVPQGTVLGPLLFLCHINDLPKSVSSQVRLFADDCLLYRQINNQKDHLALQQDLNSLQNWASNWGMKFNETKCYLMSIHRKKNPSTYYYTLSDHILQQVQDNPYLGVLINENLKWTTHINKVCGRAGSILGFIRRNLKHSNKTFKEQAYKSLVRSVLDYASIVWDPYQQKDINKIEAIQRRAARFICNDYHRNSSVTSMMETLKWKPLQQHRRELRLSFLHKMINDLVAVPANHLLEFNQRQRRHANTKLIKQVTCNTEVLKNSFIPRTICEWNSLPDSVVRLEKNEQFKSALSDFYSRQ